MHVWFRFCATLALISCVITPSNRAFAQNDSPSENEPTSMPTPGKHQLRPTAIQIVQHLIEQQGKQLSVQNQQVEHLNRQIEQQGKQIAELQAQLSTSNEQLKGLTGSLTHAVELLEALKKSRAEAIPAPTKAAQATQPAQPTPPSLEIRPAEPAEPEGAYVGVPPSTHVVKKGENLTAIARQHGTTVAELLKLNKIEDERKLQIGQTLLVPPPAATPTP